MPRLIGKQSTSGWSVSLVLILAIAAAGSLEYLGFINVIPGFGREHSDERAASPIGPLLGKSDGWVSYKTIKLLS